MAFRFLPSKREMRALYAAEGHPVFDDTLSLEAIIGFFEIDSLSFQASSELFVKPAGM